MYRNIQISSFGAEYCVKNARSCVSLRDNQLLQDIRDREDDLPNSGSTLDLFVPRTQTLYAQHLPLRDNALELALINELRQLTQNAAMRRDIEAFLRVVESGHEFVVKADGFQKCREAELHRLCGWVD
jgi:hypothetical protein